MTEPVSGRDDTAAKRTPRRGARRLTGALLATAAAGGLVAGGFSIASAASPSPASPSPAPSSPAAQGGSGAGHHRGGHAGRWDRAAHRLGTLGEVTSVGSASLTVRPAVGAAVTYTTTSATVVRTGDTRSALSALHVGQEVAVVPVRAGTSGSSTAGATATRTARLVEVVRPGVQGRVTAVGSGTVTVRDRQGFTRTVDTSGSTVYRKDGAAATRSVLTTGQWIAATGTVDADGTSLDATTVAVRTKAPQPRADREHRTGNRPAAPSASPSASASGNAA